jgi:hypothetical protein
LAFVQASDATTVQNVGAASGDLIQLICVCKDELDIGHILCAVVSQGK